VPSKPGAIYGSTAIEGSPLLGFSRASGSADAFQGFTLARRLGSISFALSLLSGIFLTQTVWGWQTAWISVSMSSIVVMALIGILIGIVFLMTVKPLLSEVLIAVGAATGAGLLAGLPSRRRRATRAPSHG
jgi:hypothetical protein